jgi:[glutamine synthetase] adenylyltransferase / [glutamine synthetase]-adenylyl-L-tyrosine phosphorylase
VETPTDLETSQSPGEQLAATSPDLGAEDRSRYLALVEAIRGPRDVALDVVPTGAASWRVAIATSDFLGALSLIVGLLTAYRLTILSADILTMRFPERRSERKAKRPAVWRSTTLAELGAPTRRLLDVFEVHALREPAPDLWTRFRADLAGLLAAERPEEARDDLIDRVSQAFRALGDPAAKLLPVSIEVSNAAGSPHTTLTVRSADTPGFLFAFASALAGVAINVERAQIRTVDGEALDTFWVTDVHGRPIVDEARLRELRIATTLIKQFTHLLPRSPNPGLALRQFSALIAQMLTRPEWTRELANLDSPMALETLADLMGVSRFLLEDFLRLQHESLFPFLLDVPTLAAARSKEALRGELHRRLRSVGTPAAKVAELNAFKDLEMFRIDLRHVAGRSAFVEFSRELTALAEVAVEAAAELAQQELLARFGKPLLGDGRPCPWCVGALGKFGGEELGFGSDLELLFVYESEGRTAGPTVIHSSEYFGRWVQTFLQTLTARQEGIFEVDLRLRPFGRAGALATSLDGFSHYYATGGAAEQFERLALVRLRPVAGDPDLGARVGQARDAFVYSGAPLSRENLLHLRQRQATELVPRGQVNAKYSPGGVVDLEYFVQAWQITIGAADVTVRATSTLDAIRRLEAGGYLPGSLAEDLRETYTFLRRLIDALRVVRGHAKDLTIPPEQSREFAYLAQRLRLATPAELRDAIARRMAFARALWTDAPPPGLL